MAQCKECTYEIPKDAQVCTTCGAPVPLEASDPSSKGGKGMDEWLLRGITGFLVVIVLAAAAFTAWSMFTQMSGGR